MQVEIKFSKKGEMKYISHLDLMRLFQRAIRRSGVPACVTKGYSPHIKISIDRALKLGLESNGEIAKIFLDSYVGISEISDRLNNELPPGISIWSVKYA